MHHQIFGDTLAIRLDPDEEILATLFAVCEKESVRGGVISGIGMTTDVTLGVMDQKVGYVKNYIRAGAEFVLTGNVSTKNGQPHIHVHIQLALSGGATVSGHLFKGIVGYTAEIFVRVLPENAVLHRDNETSFLFDGSVKVPHASS